MGGTAGEWRGISGEKGGNHTRSLARVAATEPSLLSPHKTYGNGARLHYNWSHIPMDIYIARDDETEWPYSEVHARQLYADGQLGDTELV